MAHIIVPEAEAILDKEFPVLDKGFVRLVDYLGGDARIVQAARVSYGPGTKTVREDRAPIDYLIFDGYTRVKDGRSDEKITVVLADVKTGSAALSRTERRIKEAVEAGRVKWETIRLDF